MGSPRHQPDAPKFLRLQAFLQGPMVAPNRGGYTITPASVLSDR